MGPLPAAVAGETSFSSTNGSGGEYLAPLPGITPVPARRTEKAGGRTCPATAGTGPSPSAVRILSLRTRT